MPTMVPLLPLLSAMSVPPMLSISAAPLLTLVTVNLAPLKVWPLSLVAAVTLPNRSTALPFSVKLGLTAVALTLGGDGGTMPSAITMLLMV